MNGGVEQAFAARIWRSCLATQELLTIYLGVRLGLYDALREHGPMTSAQLSTRSGVAPRYAREWAEQQAIAGILVAIDDDPEGRFALPEGHASVLTMSTDPVSLVALAAFPLGAVARALPALVEAFGSGDGVPDSIYGSDWRTGHADVNRAVFERDLPGWLENLLPSVHHRLLHGGRIADLACGAGWASIALARAYPDIQVEGFDLDGELIATARENTRRAGVSSRVRFSAADCTSLRDEDGYDLVCLFDTLHELPRPVDVLRTCRELRAEQGTVLVIDARVAESFGAVGDDVERFQYATSVLHCLPVCMSSRPSAETGTVLRSSTVRRIARQAGFVDASDLPIDDRFHRLYRLVG